MTNGPDDPKRSFDVYINKNPLNTIPIKYKTIHDIKKTIKKLERLYKSKKYSHKRIWQVSMIMRVRLKIIKNRFPRSKNIKVRYKMANRYYQFLKKRTRLKFFKNRKKMKFKII